MRHIKGFEDQYAVTEDGGIWSLKRNKFLRQHAIYSGYMTVTLRDSNNGQKPAHFFVHRLVAKAYIDNPEDKPEVHHRDADRKNNCVANLEWVTREENNQAAWDSGNKKHVVTEKFLAAVRENAKIARSKRMERLTNAA